MNDHATARPLLRVRDLSKTFKVTRREGILSRRGTVKAVEGVSLELERGRSLGIVGESGSGKSTLARCVLRLEEVSTGSVEFDGDDTVSMSSSALKQFRRRAQMVYQDPYSSLNPRQRIGDAVMEPLTVHGLGAPGSRRDLMFAMLERMGLSADFAYRFPHELSGGQRQRAGIARALISGPEMMVCDEAVSALDVSVQAQILNLLKRLQREEQLAYLFITHDIGVVRFIADDVIVMHKGSVVETGAVEDVIDNPQHEYTKKLIAAIPTGSERRGHAA
ncbi:ATP-binding cassette domain-containing protein [Brevibacterium sp.]|uniref:ATP-binding cassette domain-containing protein n=1 Tax=Brevibacterium sp. TaxID=1701 RepID=UPI0025BAC0EA|nr:ATP-binding cassette domain-containing protein [Brevibacterium sp.]